MAWEPYRSQLPRKKSPSRRSPSHPSHNSNAPPPTTTTSQPTSVPVANHAHPHHPYPAAPSRATPNVAVPPAAGSAPAAAAPGGVRVAQTSTGYASVNYPNPAYPGGPGGGGGGGMPNTSGHGPGYPPPATGLPPSRPLPGGGGVPATVLAHPSGVAGYRTASGPTSSAQYYPIQPPPPPPPPPAPKIDDYSEENKPKEGVFKRLAAAMGIYRPAAQRQTRSPSPVSSPDSASSFPTPVTAGPPPAIAAHSSQYGRIAPQPVYGADGNGHLAMAGPNRMGRSLERAPSQPLRPRSATPSSGPMISSIPPAASPSALAPAPSAAPPFPFPVQTAAAPPSYCAPRLRPTSPAPSTDRAVGTSSYLPESSAAASQDPRYVEILHANASSASSASARRRSIPKPSPNPAALEQQQPPPPPYGQPLPPQAAPEPVATPLVNGGLGGQNTYYVPGSSPAVFPQQQQAQMFPPQVYAPMSGSIPMVQYYGNVPYYAFPTTTPSMVTTYPTISPYGAVMEQPCPYPITTNMTTTTTTTYITPTSSSSYPTMSGMATTTSEPSLYYAMAAQPPGVPAPFAQSFVPVPAFSGPPVAPVGFSYEIPPLGPSYTAPTICTDPMGLQQPEVQVSQQVSQWGTPERAFRGEATFDSWTTTPPSASLSANVAVAHTPVGDPNQELSNLREELSYYQTALREQSEQTEQTLSILASHHAQSQALPQREVDQLKQRLVDSERIAQELQKRLSAATGAISRLLCGAAAGSGAAPPLTLTPNSARQPDPSTSSFVLAGVGTPPSVSTPKLEYVCLPSSSRGYPSASRNGGGGAISPPITDTTHHVMGQSAPRCTFSSSPPPVPLEFPIASPAWRETDSFLHDVKYPSANTTALSTNDGSALSQPAPVRPVPAHPPPLSYEDYSPPKYYPLPPQTWSSLAVGENADPQMSATSPSYHLNNPGVGARTPSGNLRAAPGNPSPMTPILPSPPSGEELTPVLSNTINTETIATNPVTSSSSLSASLNRPEGSRIAQGYSNNSSTYCGDPSSTVFSDSSSRASSTAATFSSSNPTAQFSSLSNYPTSGLLADGGGVHRAFASAAVAVTRMDNRSGASPEGAATGAYPLFSTAASRSSPVLPTLSASQSTAALESSQHLPADHTDPFVAPQPQLDAESEQLESHYHMQLQMVD